MCNTLIVSEPPSDLLVRPPLPMDEGEGAGGGEPRLLDLRHQVRAGEVAFRFHQRLVGNPAGRDHLRRGFHCLSIIGISVFIRRIWRLVIGGGI